MSENTLKPCPYKCVEGMAWIKPDGDITLTPPFKGDPGYPLRQTTCPHCRPTPSSALTKALGESDRVKILKVIQNSLSLAVWDDHIHEKHIEAIRILEALRASPGGEAEMERELEGSLACVRCGGEGIDPNPKYNGAPCKLCKGIHPHLSEVIEQAEIRGAEWALLTVMVEGYQHWDATEENIKVEAAAIVASHRSKP